MPINENPLTRRLRFFNDIIYELLPAAYNALDWLTFGAWWRLVRQALNYLPTGGQVLEIGFGPGRLHAEIVQQSDVCLGIDLAWGMCQFTQKRLHQANLPSLLVRGSVFSLPYKNDAFNSIVSTFAFSGFPDGAQAMAEMARVTAVDGQIILIDIGVPTDSNRLGISLAHLWESMGDFLYDLPQLMTTAGLTVTVFEEFGPGNHIRAVVGEKKRVVIN